jgi:hypothetical protein
MPEYRSTARLKNGHELTVTKRPLPDARLTHFVVTERGPGGEFIAIPYVALNAQGAHEWVIAAEFRGYGIHPDAFEADGVTLRK